MKHWIVVILALSLLLAAEIQGQTVYRWVDESGTIHFTDDPTHIPEKYRKEAEERKPLPESSSLPTTASPEARPQEVFPPPVPTGPRSSPTDRLGRGELWWRAKVKEWALKLEEARRHYEEARAALEAKTRELEGSKLKPESLQRRLRAEKKSLEEKVGHWERLVKDASEMLKKALPKEAEEYGADPAWLKPPD